ncbi:MAG: hypothetical protein J3Q66DRAFT_68828 [Benniella sp.]|nr:MAG: hypothetical protein J3Q66DRAFT_68828 [Benniella sp.]
MSGEHGETNQPLSGVMTSCPNPEPCVFGSSAQLCDTCQQVILRLIQQHNSSSQVDSIQNSLLPRTQPGAETVREQKPCHWAQTRSPVDAMSDQFSDPLAQGIAASANSRLNPASFPPGLFIPWHDSCQQDTVVSSNSSVPNQLSQFIPFPVDFAGSFAPVANTRLHTTHHRSYQQPSTPPSHTSPPPGTQNALAVDLQSQTQHSMHGQIRFLQTSHSRQLQAANQHAYQQQPQSHPQYQQHQQIQHTVQTSIYQALSQLQQQALTQLFNPMGDNLERSTPPGTTQQHSQSGQVLLSQSTRQENTNPPLTSEPVPSSLHERDYNRKQVKRRDRVQDGQPKAKRNRKNYTPEERLEIKKYRDKNPEKSFREIGDKFSLSKTSLHRILQKMTP